MTHRRWLIALVLTLISCGQSVVGSDAETTTTTTDQPSQPNQTSTTLGTLPSTTPTTDTSPVSDTTVPTTTIAPTSTLPDDSEDGEDMTQPLPGEGEAPEDYLNVVLADAAERTGIAAENLVVIRSEAVTWRDGSLGCPEPGLTYTQALIPGYWIEIEASDATLDYRLNADGAFRLCETGGLVVPEPFRKGEPIDPGS